MRGLSAPVQAAIVACGVVLVWTGAAAQGDIVGVWQQPGTGLVRGGQYEDQLERCCGGGAGMGGPAAADYLGIPLNEAGRARALAHDDSLWEVPEHQCQPHVASYAYWGPGAPTISERFNDAGQLIAYHVEGTFRRLPREIWMDGRPHPPEYARHTWGGFTTGEWKGTTLVTTTTHVKKGWVRRNGAPASDQMTLLTYYSRHDDILTVTVFVDDPVYFTEPYVKSSDYRLAPTVPTAQFLGSVADTDEPYFRCYGTEQVVFSREHPVPNYLPGENPGVGEKAKKINVPVEATLGYAETAYPEYIEKIKAWRDHPADAPRVSAPGANTQGGGAARAEQTAGDIHAVHVQGNVWMLVTPGGNLALQIGPEGALLVDTGRNGTSDAVLAAIRQVTPLPLRYIINTSAGPTAAGNNPVLGGLKGGATDRRGSGPMPAIIGHENVLAHLGAPAAPGAEVFPAVSWPSDAYLGPKRSIRYNGEAIDIIHQPSAYSDADSIVYFRGSDVVVAGEIFSTKRFPLVDRAHGGTVTGVLAGLNALEDIAVPTVIVESFNEDGTLLIPGSGRLSDKDDLTEYRDMVHIARNRIVNLVSKRQSLDAIKASRPLIDYETRYSVPEWTTSMFIDALYAELTRTAAAK